MDNSSDRLESVGIQPSMHTEKVLIELGAILYEALIHAERTDEVEILLDSIGEYSTMVSFYGNMTSRIQESLGVDLNEAALLKLGELSYGKETEWKIYAKQFKDNLLIASIELGLKHPNLD